ncbi:hypothetical protein A2U01_0115378, partial [Trifolium medium]|nr:hypothetical protein [Trifolium medium]
ISKMPSSTADRTVNGSVIEEIKYKAKTMPSSFWTSCVR